jgi:hypothetical protein
MKRSRFTQKRCALNLWLRPRCFGLSYALAIIDLASLLAHRIRIGELT